MKKSSDEIFALSQGANKRKAFNRRFIIITATLFLLMSICAEASNYGPIIYGYGKRDTPAEQPQVHLLNDEYIKALNKRLAIAMIHESRPVEKVKINITLKKTKGDLVSSINLKNNSTIDYYVHKGNLPSVWDSALASGMCYDLFLIRTKNVKLDFLGLITCEFEDKSNSEVWDKIPAGKSKQYTVKLNNSYLFLPGNHQYSVSTLPYQFVSAALIREYRISERLFSILSYESEPCRMKPKNIVYTRDDLCYFDNYKQYELPWKLKQYGIDGENYDRKLIVQSNEVVMEVNGDDISSLYEARERYYNYNRDLKK